MDEWTDGRKADKDDSTHCTATKTEAQRTRIPHEKQRNQVNGNGLGPGRMTALPQIFVARAPNHP